MTCEIDTLNNQPEFSAMALRKAIQTLRPLLGDVSVDAIIGDLELYGLLTANKHELYSIEQVQLALERMFGEAASFLMRPITTALIEQIS